MKKFKKVSLIILLLIITFFAGVWYAYPKNVKNDELEKDYKILNGWREYDRSHTQMERVGRTFVSKYSSKGETDREVLVREDYFSNFFCSNNNKPEWYLYKAHGNSLYANKYYGGSWDGYFTSVKIMDCGDVYFIKENRDMFGPFHE